MLADIAPGYEIYCTAKSDCITQRHTAHGLRWAAPARPSPAGGRRSGAGRPGAPQEPAPGHRAGQPASVHHRPLDAQPPTCISDVVANNNDIGTRSTASPFGCCTAVSGTTRRRASAASTWPVWRSSPCRSCPDRVASGSPVPTQRHPVAAEHLLATVSVLGQCLIGAYTRIRSVMPRKPLVTESEHLPAQTRRPQDDQDPARPEDPGRAAQVPCSAASGSRRRSTARSSIPAGTSRPSRRARSSGSGTDAHTSRTHPAPTHLRAAPHGALTALWARPHRQPGAPLEA